MKKAIIILGILLVLSNGWWLYNSLDQGVTQTYQYQQLYELESTRKQIMKMLPALSRNLTKEEVIEIASRNSDMEKYDKDGCTWVGWVGMKFNSKGKLESVSPVWFSGGKDPCFPEDTEK